MFLTFLKEEETKCFIKDKLKNSKRHINAAVVLGSIVWINKGSALTKQANDESDFGS